MLRSDGTVAAGPPPPVVLDPQAAIRIAEKLEQTATLKRRNLTNFIYMDLLSTALGASCCLLPGLPGRECAGNRSTQMSTARPIPARERALLRPSTLSRLRYAEPSTSFALLTNLP